MEEFRGDAGAVMSRAMDAGVARVLVASCDEASSFEVLRLAGLQEKGETSGLEIMASVGIHPHEADSASGGISDELACLSSNKYAAAIGETGLDFYYDNSPRNAQREAFEMQIEWAKRAKKPIIVHLRNAANRSEGDAYKEAWAIMKKNPVGERGGVIHCFSGDKTDAKTALDFGFYISFAGPLTYPKSEDLRGAAAYAPLDRILCETDSPYLAPQSRRGRRNEPAFVPEVYETLSNVRKTGMERLAESIWENGEKLFSEKPGLGKSE
jgi:TatD DNase family protein